LVGVISPKGQLAEFRQANSIAAVPYLAKLGLNTRVTYRFDAVVFTRGILIDLVSDFL
jgi:hypothetical protein